MGGGGGDMGPSALSYANDSGAAKICQQGAKAKRPSGGRVWEGGFFENSGMNLNGIFVHIKCHYLGVD